MRFGRFILPLLTGLSISLAGFDAFAHDQVRCADMRLDAPMAQAIGDALQQDNPTFSESLVVEPRMAGLKGPSIRLLGRDVRLAVGRQQTSPQELWHKGQWNTDYSGPCMRPKTTWMTSLKQGFYSKVMLDGSAGLTTYKPAILYRARVVAEGMMVRPYGFTLGAALSLPIATNTESLLALNDPRAPVRRDVARFANGIGLERLYASWRATPLKDVHVALSAGYLEEMYAGGGAEIVYRPWASPFWVGADAWSVWRRDADSTLNMQITDRQDFTGHVRGGYDIPGTHAGLYAAAGKYLAGDVGGTIGAMQTFENGIQIEAAVTWTDRQEDEGFFRDAKFDPLLRVKLPLGGAAPKREARGQMRQIGRDGGQMLDRPLPLERMTEDFAAREVVRHWPELLTKKEAAYIGGL